MRLIIVTQTVDADAQFLGFFVEWIRAFAARCEHVTVIARSVGRYDLPGNMVVRSMGAEKGAGRVRRILNLWRELWRALPESDGVFIHMIPLFALVAWPLTALRRKPLTMWYAHKSVDLPLKLSLLCVDRVFTSSKEGFRLASPKVMVVGQGIPVAARPRVAHDGFRLIAVGRLSPVKRLEVLIEALGKLKDDARVTLTIVGGPVAPEDHEYLAKLRAQATALGVESRVTFAGIVPYEKLWDVYAEHDLYVHASETGSIDKVVLEAMISGLPAVTSSEAFADLDASMRFPKGDAAALAERIRSWQRRLAGDPNLGAVLAERVRATHGLPQLIDRIVTAIAGLGNL